MSTARLRLPDGWSRPETVEDVIVADGLPIRRAGVASVAPSGEEVTGSAASLTSAPPAAAPAPRSWFELVERASVVEAMRSRCPRFELLASDGAPVRSSSHEELFPESDDPSRWRYARSNGVAVHADWERARDRALWELAERDRVLASWHGHVRPERIGGAPAGLDAAASLDWSTWALPEERPGAFSRGLEVVAVVGLPAAAGAPLVLGFAARPHRGEAIDAAASEAVQVLGFLWGEPVGGGPFEPTALGHLDLHQADPRAVRAWLDGDHVRFASGDGRPGARDDEVLFADLTPAWLDSGERVVKAVCPAARPLIFGHSPSAAHLPEGRRIHPIA